FAIVVFCLIFNNFSYSQSFQSNFNKAAILYEKGDYDKAIEEYNFILESGFESGNLYYNLGNCYFKKGELGLAILNYEKAKRFIPFDRDLQANYKYASSLIEAQPIISQKFFLFKVLDNIFENFSLDGLTIFSSLMYILILSSILTTLFLKKFKKYAIILCFISLLFFIAGSITLFSRISSLGKEAIVIKKELYAKFEPFPTATNYFSLYEGMKVRIIWKKEGWYKIKRQDNKIGWVEKDALAII
ncbi:MAG: SH3 domain-containing protein, partial [Candidatus Omnitrophica bacterium]|nr:SH3 domain-containing protein [Candidatus Omnitrophota bacterium]